MKTKTKRVSRTQPKVYPFGIKTTLGRDVTEDKRNTAARVAYGDKAVRAMAATFGASKTYTPKRKK